MWASLALARDVWPDAPSEDDVLERLLVAAHEVCEIYAPDLVDGAAIPQRYVEANILQAREIWSATRRDGGVIGLGDGYALRATDLTPEVRGLLRPRRGFKRLG